VGSAGAIVGQLLGGVLTTAFGWRAIFLINVAIGIATIAAAARHLADSRGPTQPRLDVRGAALLTAGLAAVILTPHARRPGRRAP
jgi:MFS family permease